MLALDSATAHFTIITCSRLDHLNQSAGTDPNRTDADFGLIFGREGPWANLRLLSHGAQGVIHR